MKERFENRVLAGPFAIKCKNDDGSFRMWEDQKETVIGRIASTVRRYISMGYRLTLRQLHYQLVTRNWIVNHDTAYKKLGDILDDCRYAGEIDWEAIEDRGRVPHLLYSTDSVTEALEETHEYYRRNRQEGQENVVEVWTEKDALSGILKRPTERYHVRLVVNKGYTSSSALYRAYQRVLEAIALGNKFTILYFGDHDPSGLDMIRDIRERLMKFLSQGTQLRNDEPFMDKMRKDWEDRGGTIYDLYQEGLISEKLMNKYTRGDGGLEYEDYDAFENAQIHSYIEQEGLFSVVPIGLTMEQIKKYNLPPNPTKMTDARAAEYVKKFGRTCWEVDALDPEVLDKLVDDKIREHIDVDQYEAMMETEEEDKDELRILIDNSKNGEGEQD